MSFQQHSSQPGRGYANSNINIQQPSRQDKEINGSRPRTIDSPGASRYVGGSVDGLLDVAESPMQVGRGHAIQAAPFEGIVTVREKSRTSCNFCTARKKRCDYVEINGQKQPCRLCKERNRECVFDKKPPRKTAGPSTGGSKRAKKRSSGGNNGALVIHRASMGPSPATGLVGLEENMFVADFFDRLGFFPISNERNIQRAIMEVLFRPAIEGNKRRGSDTDSSMSGESVVNEKIDSETALSLPMRRTDSNDLESVFGGYAGVRRRWELQGENKAFSCMLWCTIAIGAMTSNLRTITVKQYVKLAEEAIDGLWSPDVATAKAYANMSMLYAFLDKEEQFSKHLSAAKELIDAMDNNPNYEEVPLDLRDIVNELDRILSLHYSDDMEVIKRCCYKADGEPPQMSPLLMCESGLFHIVRFYTDGVFKAFWRDVLKRDPVLSETKKFSEKHQKECLNIENIANTRTGLKDTGGALYIRAAMQFMRLPLKTDPRQVLRSSIELTNIICKVPGMIRFGPLKHYVHCLVMGLARPAMAGVDEGAYEKLRAMYNSLDIAGPAIVAAEDMEIANLCKHPFCKGMAWSHQQKAIRQMKAQAQAAGAGAGDVPHAATPMGVGNGRDGTGATASAATAAAATASSAAASVGVAPGVERRISQQPISIGGRASAVSSPAVSSYSTSFTHSSSSSAAAATTTTSSAPGSVGGVHRMVHSSGGTVAADNDAQGNGSSYSQQLHGSSRTAMGMADLAEVFSKEEVRSSYSQGIGIGNGKGEVAPINGGQAPLVENNHMFSSGSTWHHQHQNQRQHQQKQMMNYHTQRRRQQQQQHDSSSDESGDSNGRSSIGLAAEKLMVRHPRGGPSVSSFLSQPGRHQYQQQQQQRYQDQYQYQYGQQQEMLLAPREGEAGQSMSMSISSRTEVNTVSSSVQSMPMPSASVQSMPMSSASVQSMPMPSASVQSASVQSMPMPSASVQSASVQSIPMRSASVQSSSIQSMPVQSASVQSSCIQSMPVQSASVQSMSMRPVSVQSASIQSTAPPAPAGDIGMMADSEDSEMPPDVYSYAQQQVRRQQAERERSANVNNLDELLLVNDDDRGDVPDMYEGESDAGDFDSFMAGSVTGVMDEQADESLSSLAALLR